MLDSTIPTPALKLPPGGEDSLNWEGAGDCVAKNPPQRGMGGDGRWTPEQTGKPHVEDGGPSISRRSRTTPRGISEEQTSIVLVP